MPYKLKSKENEFQVTREGKFEYRSYKHGILYDEIPPEEAKHFEKTDTGAQKEDVAPPAKTIKK